MEEGMIRELLAEGEREKLALMGEAAEKDPADVQTTQESYEEADDGERS